MAIQKNWQRDNQSIYNLSLNEICSIYFYFLFYFRCDLIFYYIYGFYHGFISFDHRFNWIRKTKTSYINFAETDIDLIF